MCASVLICCLLRFYILIYISPLTTISIGVNTMSAMRGGLVLEPPTLAYVDHQLFRMHFTFSPYYLRKEGALGLTNKAHSVGCMYVWVAYVAL